MLSTELFQPLFSAIFTAKLQRVCNYCTFRHKPKIKTYGIISLYNNCLDSISKNISFFVATFLVILANEGHSSKLK